MSRAIILIICFSLLLNLTGCSKKKSTQTTDVPETDAQKTSNATQTIQKISDNPAFFTALAVSPKSAEVKDLDKLFNPILTELFEDAKLIEQSDTPETKADGEVVENKMVYIVRMILTPQEGDNLHTALKKAGFAASVRLGSKPTHSRTAAFMSLMKTTSLRGYSLVIIVDAEKQRIVIESYKLGSKYDRMM